MLPPSVLQFWYILMDTLMMVVSASACHDQDNTFTPGSSVWNERVDGSVGHCVLVESFVIRHALVLESVAPQDLSWDVGGANLRWK